MVKKEWWCRVEKEATWLRRWQAEQHCKVVIWWKDKVVRGVITITHSSQLFCTPLHQATLSSANSTQHWHARQLMWKQIPVLHTSHIRPPNVLHMSPTVPHHSLLFLVCFCFIISQIVQATANLWDSTLLVDKNKVEDNTMCVTLIDSNMVKLRFLGLSEPKATTYAAELWVTCLLGQ